MKLEIKERTPPSGAAVGTILFIHGMMHGAWCREEHYLPYFAGRGYRALALSLRGHGASEGRDRLRFTSIRDYVEDVERAAAELEAPVVMVGHSMGGFILQKYLERHRMAAAVLMTPVPPYGIIGPTLRTAARHPLRFLKANAALSFRPLICDRQAFRELFLSADLAPDKAETYFALGQDESYLAYVQMLALVRARAAKNRSPVMVIGGERDLAISVAEVRATARAYGVTPVVLPDMAHDMMLDPLWERGAEVIAEWLGRTIR